MILYLILRKRQSKAIQRDWEGKYQETDEKQRKEETEDCYKHQPEHAGEGTWTPKWEVIAGEETTQFHGEL